LEDRNFFPIPAVRLIVPDEKDRVLILRRIHTNHAPGAWCLPGGKIDYGETVEKAGQRELFEETGLFCEEMKFLFYQDSLPLETGAMHCINFYLECRCRGPILLNHESSDYAWMSPEEFAQYPLAFRNDEAVQYYWQNRRKGNIK